MDPLPESQATRRLRILARLAFVWALLILAKLIYLQVYLHHEILRVAAGQHTGTVEVAAPRGRIVDRTGQTLAMSVPADLVAINPRRTPNLEVAREILCRLLDLDSAKLQQRMSWAVEHNRGFLSIKRKISPEESRKLRSLKLDWMEFRKESKRCYPKGALAANIIGSVDHRESGNSGLEASLDEELRGKPGLVSRLRDALRRGVDSRIILEPRPGNDVGISIDERIQHTADRELEKAVKLHECETGSLVVMDPRNGEILAMSNYPTFDPNARVITKEDLAARTNLAVSVPFEPGSVFKVVTLAAALDATSLTPSTPIDCGPGVMRLFGRRIRDVHAHGTIPVEKVLAKSSNIGVIRIALEVGEERLLDYVRRFGFGQRTGIPLPAESAGKVRDLAGWTRTSIGSVAMGHELSTTSLQLALATSVIANGGLLPKPRLVLWRQTPGEAPRQEPLEAPRPAIKPETAITMRRMMEAVVLSGTGRRARLAGFTCGGKTGSAQIFDPETWQYTHRYNSSFAGFAPVQDPSVVVVVALNGASRFGGVVAAPVFREVTAAALRIMGTVPDLPAEEPLPENEFEEEDMTDLAFAELAVPLADGPPRQDAPEPPQERVSPYVFGPTVPNFYGKSLRTVLAECTQIGAELEYHGRGLARRQDPPPGAVLPAGQRVRVMFAR